MEKTTVDEDVEEGTSGQGLRTNRAGPSKARKRLESQISEDEFSTGNEDVPVSLTTMGLAKKKKPATMDNEKRPTSVKMTAKDTSM